MGEASCRAPPKAPVTHEALTRRSTSTPPTDVDVVAVWPPFQLGPGDEPAAALQRAVKEAGLDPRLKAAGPSNRGSIQFGDLEWRILGLTWADMGVPAW